MANSDPQKHLLSLIRDFATERSHGERRVSDLKRRSDDLRSELEAANAELESAEASRKASDQGLKVSQTERDLVLASIQPQEARIALLQDEISAVQSAVAKIKDDEAALGDEFIRAMSEQNQKIRKFQDMIHSFKQEKKIADGKALHNNQNVMQTVEDEIAHYNAQIHMMEQMCVEELNVHQKVLKELASLDRKLVLAKAVMNETKELQELARRVAESEKAYALSVEQLQRYACPNCGVDNMGDSVLAVLEEGGN